MNKSTTAKIMDDFANYVMGNYIRYPIVMERGKGSYVWDTEGNRYLDFFSGWATTGLGHAHPNVVKAISSQAEKLIHVPNIYYTEQQGKLARLIIENSFSGKVFFCNSGAEANEAALKLARKYGAENGGKHEIITFKNSFHGRTIGAVTATGQPKYHKGFAPLPEGFIYVDFDNNIDTVLAAVTDKTAAIMLELIQGEGGVNPADKKFIKELKSLCEEKDILLIVDEVQTGIGRTGEMFAFLHYDIKPDVMTLAKGLGNGTAVGAMVCRDKFSSVLSPGTHASTFGGNPLACSAAVSVFETIEKDNILDNVREQGNYLVSKLKELQDDYPDIIKDIRGKGLMIGVELNVEDGSFVVGECLKKKMLTNCTHGNIIRLMPMLNIEQDEIDEAVAILTEVIKESKGK